MAEKYTSDDYNAVLDKFYFDDNNKYDRNSISKYYEEKAWRDAQIKEEKRIEYERERLLAEEKYREFEHARKNNERLKLERENAVKDAKQRYKAKSSLWKFFHRKLNPQNINFSNLDVHEIHSMYR
ncbi:MAG: hypothetical protein IJD92_00460 [Bacilli bacterium]|nr:hypothetical protein [Bacilli bacterium]